jgi:hypothetical protein
MVDIDDSVYEFAEHMGIIIDANMMSLLEFVELRTATRCALIADETVIGTDKVGKKIRSYYFDHGLSCGKEV